jgi:hypothetical protein
VSKESASAAGESSAAGTTSICGVCPAGQIPVGEFNECAQIVTSSRFGPDSLGAACAAEGVNERGVDGVDDRVTIPDSPHCDIGAAEFHAPWLLRGV